MEVRIILRTFIVCLGLGSVRSINNLGIKVAISEGNDGKRIQENFRNLFDSIGKNDGSKTDTYRNVLERETAKEQQAFDTMKTELQFARQKTMNRQRNFHHQNSYTGEKTSAIKREAHEPATCSDTDENSEPEYCKELKSALRDYRMDVFIKTVNDRYKEQYTPETFPQSNEQCRETLNLILRECGINTIMDFKIRRVLTECGGEWKNRTIYEEAGVIDIMAQNYTEASNLVVKVRYKKRRACIPFNVLLPYLERPNTFRNRNPNAYDNILALSFKVGGDPAIDEWISLLHRNGEVVNATHQAPCLTTDEFKDLKLRGKPVLEYFKQT